jgi:hypothetical protein
MKPNTKHLYRYQSADGPSAESSWPSLALGVESAPLKPVEAPLELVAEPIEDLATVVLGATTERPMMAVPNFMPVAAGISTDTVPPIA